MKAGAEIHNITCAEMQTRQQECVQLADLAKPVLFQLILDVSELYGAGLLTVTLKELRSSVYVHLTGCASYITVDLGKDFSPSQLTSDATSDPTRIPGSSDRYSSSLSSLTVPASLMYGAAIQLHTPHPMGRVTDLPYYAVSEEVLMDALHSGAAARLPCSQTTYDGTLLGLLGHKLHDQLSCPVAAHPTMHDRQASEQEVWEEVTVAMPVRSISHEAFSLLPWYLCACLLLCMVGLALHNRRCYPAKLDSEPVQSAAPTAEISYARSNQALVTPTKDTGCSPFVPVTHAPGPHVAFSHTYLASCSSKIGSHRAPKPSASRAVTNMTSNVSGCTKWQRSKNGRLLSQAVVDLDEHTS
ncbi:TPA: hypothetical protein ACH3X2_003412 [Trebouxia sp. C0005]